MMFCRRAWRGFECGFNEKTVKLIFLIIITILLLIAVLRLFFVAHALGVALAVLTVLSCLLAIISAMTEIAWLMFGYLIVCAFYLVTSVVNLIIEILEKLGPVAYGLDAVFIVFYLLGGIVGLLLYKFFRENDMSKLGLQEYV